MSFTLDNVSPDTVRGVGEVLKLAAYLDPKFPQPDDALTAAWSIQVARHRLGHEDLLAGFQAYYDAARSHPMGVGDLIEHSKVARRARIEKEPDTEREARREQLDAKADNTWGLAAKALPAGPVDPADETPRLKAAREALDICYGKDASREAIREYLAARVEATQLRKAAPPKGRREYAVDVISAALTVPCPWETCRAKVGAPCLLDGQTRAVPHPSRIDAAKETTHA